MDLEDRPIITVESEFSIHDGSDPDMTAETIENAIHELFHKTIQNDKPSNIIVIENKGWNLYQPYLKKLVGFHPLSRLKPFHHSNSSRLVQYASINPNNDTVLLTDAVNSGSEINRVLQGRIAKRFHFKDRITKIVGYIATEDGLQNIHDRNPDVTVKFRKIVTSLKEYDDEQKRLRLVYQNRMEPIDGEHPYMTLRPNEHNLSIETIKSLITSSIPEFYSGEYNVVENYLKIRDKKSITVHFYNPESFGVNLKEFSRNTFIFEKIALRFKYSFKDSLLRVAAIAMTDDKRNMFSVFSRVVHGKCNQNFPYKACQLYSPLKRFNILGSSFCPMCIDNNISRYIISNFVEAYRKVSEKNEIKWEVIETYLGI
jgi:hypothetical protein